MKSQLKALVSSLAERFGYVIHRNALPPDMEALFLQDFRACAPHLMTSIQRECALHSVVVHVLEFGIEGDLVECGAWRGGSSLCLNRVRHFWA